MKIHKTLNTFLVPVIIVTSLLFSYLSASAEADSISPARLKFTSTSLWSDNFSDPNGWHKDPAYYSTIQFPDLNGDGKADMCGRGYSGMLCALSIGTSFTSVTLWSDNFSDPNGWHKDPAYYSTIQFPDLNGDGKADLCGRGYSGMLCALSTGSAFTPVVLWSDNFSDPNGWHKDPAYYSTIQFPDLNGDGKADLCGRGYSGMLCALSTGSAFTPVVLWSDNFSDSNGWHKDPAYYSTIQLPDLNGDSKADLCGRGYAGMLCALSNGSAFTPVVLWSDNFSDPNRWHSSPAYYRTIQFPDLNGDKKADLCGRGYSGMLCALSNDSSFTTVELWSDTFSNPRGWHTTRAYYRTIQFPDLNNDRMSDLCGRGYTGVHCATITLSNEPKTDNGFRPNPDGYSFQNYGGINGADLTVEDLRPIFGDNAVCLFTTSNVCLYNPAAVQWRNRWVEVMDGGHCYGMAVTSSRYFAGVDQPSSVQPGANKTFDLHLINARRNIASYFVRQGANPVASTLQSSLAQTPVQVLQKIRNSFDNRASSLTIAIFGNGAGHAVTPYNVVEKGNGLVWIMVYDNNHPNDANRHIDFNTNSNTWSYDLGGMIWSGNTNTHSIGVIPYHLNNAIMRCPWCRNSINGSEAGETTQIWAEGSAQIVVTNEAGQRYGYVGDTFVQEIPDASTTVLMTGLQQPGPTIYNIPVNGDHTITLDGMKINQPTTMTVSQFGPNYAVTVDGITECVKNGETKNHEKIPSKASGARVQLTARFRGREAGPSADWSRIVAVPST